MQNHPKGLCVACESVVLSRGSRRDTKLQVLFHYCYFASRYDFLMVVDGIGGNWASRKREERSQNTFLVWRRAVPETGENSQLCLLNHAWYKEHKSWWTPFFKQSFSWWAKEEKSEGLGRKFSGEDSRSTDWEQSVWFVSRSGRDWEKPSGMS